MTALRSCTLTATTYTSTNTFGCDSWQYWTVLYPSLSRICHQTWRQQRQLKKRVIHV